MVTRYKIAGYCCGAEPSHEGGFVTWGDHEAALAKAQQERDRWEETAAASERRVAHWQDRAEASEAALAKAQQERDGALKRVQRLEMAADRAMKLDAEGYKALHYSEELERAETAERHAETLSTQLAKAQQERDEIEAMYQKQGREAFKLFNDERKAHAETSAQLAKAREALTSIETDLRIPDWIRLIARAALPASPEKSDIVTDEMVDRAIDAYLATAPGEDGPTWKVERPRMRAALEAAKNGAALPAPEQSE